MRTKRKAEMRAVQNRVWRFIEDFRDRTVELYESKIDFIIIYGSAVRGEFVPGKSDVDILVQIFRAEEKEEIEKGAADIFWEIAKDYPDLQFEKSLSVAKDKQGGAVSKFLEKIERSSFLYVPVFVFAKGEIDWEKGELKSEDPLVVIGQNLLVPQRSVFLRFKQEGRILFGRDVRKEIKIRLTLADRLRQGFAPQVIALAGFLVSPFAADKARSYSIKALLYQIDALLVAIDHYRTMGKLEKIEKEKQLLLDDFTGRLSKILKISLDAGKGLLRPGDFELFQFAIALKWGEVGLTPLQTVGFSLRACWFIFRCNLRAVGYLLLKTLSPGEKPGNE